MVTSLAKNVLTSEECMQRSHPRKMLGVTCEKVSEAISGSRRSLVQIQGLLWKV